LIYNYVRGIKLFLGKVSHETKIQFIKFCIIGVLTFIIDVSILYYTTTYLKFSTQLGTSIAFVITLIFHFTLNKIINFKSMQRKTIQQLRTYGIIVLLSYCSTILFMTIFVEYLSMSITISKALTVFINALWGFPAQKYLTFSSGIRKVIFNRKHNKR
jgi:putative flippase GtrA